jgi:hypothetical protein
MKRIAFVLAGALAAGSAAADHREIKVEDTSTFIPSLRLGIDISPRVEGPSVPHSGHGIEIGITGTTGKDTQTRDFGAPPLVFGGQVFASPNQLNHEFDWRFIELCYRYRHFFGAGQYGEGGSFGIEGLGGLGYAEYDLTVTTATQRANEKLGSGGLVLGFGIIWKFLPRTSLQSRITVFGSGENEGVSGAGRWDLFVVQALGRHAAVRAGFTGWGLSSTRDDDEDATTLNSLIRSGFSGFALGLDLAF